jgi:hypothetical protein
MSRCQSVEVRFSFRENAKPNPHPHGGRRRNCCKRFLSLRSGRRLALFRLGEGPAGAESWFLTQPLSWVALRHDQVCDVT